MMAIASAHGASKGRPYFLGSAPKRGLNPRRFFDYSPRCENRLRDAFLTPFARAIAIISFLEIYFPRISCYVSSALDFLERLKLSGGDKILFPDWRGDEGDAKPADGDFLSRDRKPKSPPMERKFWGDPKFVASLRCPQRQVASSETA